MTDNKKATLENNKAKVEKSKSDKKEYSNKPSSDQVVDRHYKAIIKRSVLDFFAMRPQPSRSSTSSTRRRDQRSPRQQTRAEAERGDERRVEEREPAPAVAAGHLLEGGRVVDARVK